MGWMTDGGEDDAVVDQDEQGNYRLKEHGNTRALQGQEVADAQKYVADLQAQKAPAPPMVQGDAEAAMQPAAPGLKPQAPAPTNGAPIAIGGLLERMKRPPTPGNLNAALGPQALHNALGPQAIGRAIDPRTATQRLGGFIDPRNMKQNLRNPLVALGKLFGR